MRIFYIVCRVLWLNLRRPPSIQHAQKANEAMGLKPKMDLEQVEGNRPMPCPQMASGKKKSLGEAMAVDSAKRNYSTAMSYI
jgi:hypothetical protein